MSWPQWSGNSIAPVPTAPVINPAPAVAPPGFQQYTPEQWTQLQQQNWSQWATWQQQYQQWHQQYGAEYQKSMNAINAQSQTPSALPNIAVPPPLPNVAENKPPLPTEDPPPNVSYSTLPPQPAPPVSNYTTAPPPVAQPQPPPPNKQNYPRNNKNNPKWQNQRYSNNSGSDFYQNQNQNKRGFEPASNEQENKRQKPWHQTQPPPLMQQQLQIQNNPRAVSVPKTESADELSEAEKKFDKQFAEWEAQFNKWKEQNSEHPDKEQYKEYEKRWESWRAQLLERREQMKRKRLGLSDSPNLRNNKQSFPQQQQKVAQAPQNQAKPGGLLPTPPPPSSFNKPPPNLNDEPLKFKAQNTQYSEVPLENFESDGGDFLKPMSGGGIPGLDLVIDDPVPEKPASEDVVILDGENEKKGPDFDAISKGINNILGDQKLLNMLSMVSQNQSLQTSDNIVNTTSKIQEGNNQEEQYQEQSNQSYEEQSNQSENFGHQREYVNNFDDQTRSSFTHNEYDNSGQFGRNQQQQSNRFDSFDKSGGNRFAKQEMSDDPQQFNPQNRNNSQFERNDQFRNSGGAGAGRGDRFHPGSASGQFPPQQNNENFGRGNRFNESNQFENERSQNQFGNENRFGNNNRFNNKENFGDYKESDNFDSNQDFSQYDDYNNFEENYENYEEYDESYNNQYENEEEWQEDQQEYENQDEYNTHAPPLIDQPPPLQEKEEEILKPATVIDYEHKPIKPAEPEILIEPIFMFDYRHKPISRIPLPQRPKWLSEAVKNIREFDPPVVRPYEPPGLRRYPGAPPLGEPWRSERWPQQHSRRNYPERRPQPQQLRENNRYDGQKEWNNYERRPRENELQKKPSFNSDFGKFDRENRSETKSMDLEDEDNISEPDWESVDDAGVERNNDFVNFEQSESSSSGNKPNFSKNVVLIEDIINAPGRLSRPPRIVIILRGPPGSGKTFLAKLIKDKEVENGGSTPRILSLDDYFMVEQEKEVTEDGKTVNIKDMVYEYEEEMEESYRLSLTKSFRKTVTDGYFSFIIVDNVNDKVKYFGDMWSFAKQNGFQVYVCQLDLDVPTCSKRNIHGRTEAEIEKCVAAWEPTPAHHPTLDATSLLQSASIPEVEMEEVNSPESEEIENDASEDEVARSKWDNFDCSVDNLAKLDGVSKPLRHSRTMEEYLQLESDWAPSTRPTKPGQKRVRWADLEEQKQQEKMRAIGFVVGQTNWDRMMDPTNGGSALTQTKYIERTGRYKVDQM